MNLPPSWYVVIWPGTPVSTAGIFQAPELTRNSPVSTIRAPLQDLTRNDCLPVVRSRYPSVAAALDWLGVRTAARLSGTGACVFASFPSAAEAERIAGRVPDEWTSFVARGVNVSPLRAVLSSIN